MADISPKTNQLAALSQLAIQLSCYVDERDVTALSFTVDQSKRRYADICAAVSSALDDIVTLRDILATFNQWCAAILEWMDQSEALVQMWRPDFSNVMKTTAKIAEVMVYT